MVSLPPRVAAASILLLCFGCESRDRSVSKPDHSRGDLQAPIPRAPADSLVLTSAGGAEVWYGLSRSSRRPGGSSCTERGLEIRRGPQRIRVPLLYTGETPTLLNDSTMRAVLWTNCQPGDTYLVDLSSGRPVRQSKGAR